MASRCHPLTDRSYRQLQHSERTVAGTLPDYQPAAKSGLVLPSSHPPLAPAATIHGSAIRANRRTAAAAATPTASNASRQRRTASRDRPELGVQPHASAVKWARISSARTSNRRSQPRIVLAGSPNSSRDPPSTLHRPPWPPTPRRSPRPGPGGGRNTTTGNNTCVTRQARQRATPHPHQLLRTLDPAASGGHEPHGRSSPPHAGHASPPATSSRSTTPGSGLYHQHRCASPGRQVRNRASSRRNQGGQTLTATTTGIIAAESPSVRRSSACRRAGVRAGLAERWPGLACLAPEQARSPS